MKKPRKDLPSDNSVYEKLYDVIEKNLTEAGQDMFFSKEVFVATSVMNKTVFDYQKAKGFDNQTFVYMTYRYIWNILPQPGDERLVSWQEAAAALPKEQLQHRIMRSLIDTIPAVICHSTIVHNDLCPVMSPVQETAAALPNKLHHKIYRKLPAPLQMLAKPFGRAAHSLKNLIRK